MACLWISNHSFSLVTVRMIKQRFTKLSLWASKYSTKYTILRNASGRPRNGQLNFWILSFICVPYHQWLLRGYGWLFLTTLPPFHFNRLVRTTNFTFRTWNVGILWKPKNPFPDRIRQKNCLQSFTFHWQTFSFTGKDSQVDIMVNTCLNSSQERKPSRSRSNFLNANSTCKVFFFKTQPAKVCFS